MLRRYPGIRNPCAGVLQTRSEADACRLTARGLATTCATALAHARPYNAGQGPSSRRPAGERFRHHSIASHASPMLQLSPWQVAAAA